MFLNSFFVCDRVELYASLTKCIVRREVRDISQTNLGTNMRATMFNSLTKRVSFIVGERRASPGRCTGDSAKGKKQITTSRRRALGQRNRYYTA